MPADTAMSRDEINLRGFRPGGAMRGRTFKERYMRASVWLFGPTARRASAKDNKLRITLEQAHIPILPATFIAMTWMGAFLTAIAGYTLVAGGLLVISLSGNPLPSPLIQGVLYAQPLILAALAYVVTGVYPDYLAGERRRGIHNDVPYAANYIAAMASAGVVPTVIVRDIARQTAYGEAAREFAWMARDVDVLGQDLLGAINNAIARTPSLRFQEFLQGAKTTILSGGELKTYFQSKAEQYMAENRRVQKEFLDSLAVMAESYVTVAIAGPLFMIVLLSIMVVIGSTGDAVEVFLFVLVFILLPIIHIVFTWLVKNLAPEG